MPVIEADDDHNNEDDDVNDELVEVMYVLVINDDIQCHHYYRHVVDVIQMYSHCYRCLVAPDIMSGFFFFPLVENINF